MINSMKAAYQSMSYILIARHCQLAFSLHPLIRFILVVVLVQGIYSTNTITQCATILTLIILQCPRQINFKLLCRSLLISTFAVSCIFILFILLNNTPSAMLAPLMLRLWLFLISLPLLFFFLQFMSTVDWIILSNTLTKYLYFMRNPVLYVALLAASLSIASRSLVMVLLDYTTELRTRRLWQPGMRRASLIGLLTAFITELLRIALEFNDEWTLRFNPKDNSLTDLTFRWSLLDLGASVFVLLLLCNP